MMMFAIAGALLITGGALGTPWLTDFFGGGQQTSSANEAGVVCPANIVGLALASDGEVEARGSVFVLHCEYVLSPSKSVSAEVSVTWTETGPVGVLQRGCGLPPSVTPGVFTVEGSYYGSQGQARADYAGQTRYANAMQTLASNLVGAAGSVSEPCPSQAIVANPNTTADPNDPNSVGTPQTGSEGPGSSSTGGSGSEGTGSGNTPGTVMATPTNEPDEPNDGPRGFGEPIASADVPQGSCVVQGRITDANGVPVPLIQMSVHDVTRSFIASTSSNGAGTYRFEEPVEAGGTVRLTPTDGGRTQPFFRILAGQAGVTLSRDLSVIEPVNGICEVNFDIWNLEENYSASDENLARWPAIVELYQNFNRAAALAELLEAPMDYGLPIPVYAWCDSSELFCDPTGVAEFAFYSGSSTGRFVDQPYMALGFPTSEIDYRGTPDNREYHEFGHVFHADVLNNQIPIHIGDHNHGGYYRNETTTDSFIEGFAEFYSVMVSKHIDQAANPHRYKIGAEYDIEDDRMPWEAVGWWEEFTLAGLLLDFEDGPEDYANPPLELDVESVSALEAENGNFAIGRVRNLGTKVTHGPEVTVDLIDDDGNAVFTQVTAVRPDSLGPGQTGVFYVAAPEGVEFSDVNAVPGRPAATDDDGIDLELSDLMRAITADWGARSDYVRTVKELHEALSREFAGKDVDNDGSIDATQEQIDQIFIRHGFFDDLDGNREWNEETDGEIGGSAHPAVTVAGTNFSEMIPRSSAVGFAGSYVDIDTAGVDADILVQVEFDESSESYAYWKESGTTRPVELAVPAGESGASVTVIAAAEDHNPAVAYRTTAQQFHAAVESGEITTEPVQASVQIEEGDPFALLGAPSDSGAAGEGESNRAGVPPWTMLLPVALAMAMLVGGFYLMRRTGNAGAGNRKL